MKKLIFIITVLALSACQNKNNRHRADYNGFVEQQGLVKKDRVRHFKFQGWQPLNDRYLILRSSQRTSFLVKLLSACTELPFAQNIKVKQDAMTTLNAKFDSIIVPGQFRQECTIDTIYELDKIQKQALLDFSNQKEEVRG